MHILKVELEHFRNFRRAVLKPSETVTALVGDNGQGKTNALEAIYLASALRPLRMVARRALIHHQETVARVLITVRHQRTGLIHHLEVRLESSKRTLFRDEKKTATPDYLGSLVSVAFTPDDLQLPKGGPDGRRRFLDRALLNARPRYLSSALRYAKGMKDRNRLLMKPDADLELDAFDTLLASEGAAIIEARRKYTARIAPLVAERFATIAGPAPALKLAYRSTVPALDAQSTESAFVAALTERRERDRRKATTGVGPHLDDLQITLGGEPVRERASQGQHRAIALALKLVEIEQLAQDLGEAPILLLDDMSSELDPQRTEQLFQAVSHLDAQVILTSTTYAQSLRTSLRLPGPLSVFRVASGALTGPEIFPSPLLDNQEAGPP